MNAWWTELFLLAPTATSNTKRKANAPSDRELARIAHTLGRRDAESVRHDGLEVCAATQEALRVTRVRPPAHALFSRLVCDARYFRFTNCEAA